MPTMTRPGHILGHFLATKKTKLPRGKQLSALPQYCVWDVFLIFFDNRLKKYRKPPFFENFWFCTNFFACSRLYASLRVVVAQSRPGSMRDRLSSPSCVDLSGYKFSGASKTPGADQLEGKSEFEETHVNNIEKSCSQGTKKCSRNTSLSAPHCPTNFIFFSGQKVAQDLAGASRTPAGRILQMMRRMLPIDTASLGNVRRCLFCTVQ